MERVRNAVLVLCCFVVLLVSVVSQAAPKSKMIGFWNDYESSSRLKVDHSRWQSILDRYLNEKHSSGISRFDYDRVTPADKQILTEYLTYLQRMDPRQLNRPSKKAFWLNLYNATVVSMVLGSPSKKGIKSFSNVWRKKRLVIARQKMSLDDIQHGVLRPIYNDPRIHFGLTPATLGSGDLPASAYTGENVEELLERNTQRFFNASNKGVYVTENTMVVSTIFKWYKNDFDNNNADLKSFINKYVDDQLVAQIDQASKISYQYDWGLNKP